MSGEGVGRAPLLEMHGINKSFFGVPVLSGVDLDCQAGEVHAIVGENGAGKSTLMKILAGAYQPDSGSIRLDGHDVHFGHPGEAKELGVSLIYQEFTLLPERTVAQNIFLGREPRRGLVVDSRAMEDATHALLSTLEVEGSISPSAPVRSLPVAQQQLVEIAKALSFEARILVMDEPTAALPPHEVEALFRVVRRLRERGLAILYVSHRLKEVFSLAGRITVLKDGQRVATVRTEEVTTGELVRMMVGRELETYFPPRATVAEIGQPRLLVREEKDPPAAIRSASGRIAHVQVCGNDRGAPGSDHTGWQAILDALDDADYRGPLCIESFSAGNMSLARAASIWRPLERSQDAIATDGLAFLNGLMARRESQRSAPR